MAILRAFSRMRASAVTLAGAHTEARYRSGWRLACVLKFVSARYVESDVTFAGVQIPAMLWNQAYEKVPSRAIGIESLGHRNMRRPDASKDRSR
jgi:hypothetical protein